MAGEIQLNYDGVVITDCLTMAAIKDNYDIGNAAVRAIKAGVDIVLVSHEYENYLVANSALQQAVQRGIITTERLNQNVNRVLSLKAKYLQTNEVYQ